MMSYLWIFLLASLAFGQEPEDPGLDLGAALDPEPAPAATSAPAAPEESAGNADTGGDLDLAAAADPAPTAEPEKPADTPEKPPEDPNGGGLNLEDAFGDPEPEKPADDKPTDDAKGGGSFGDIDLDFDSNDNKPGGKARAADPAPGSDGGPADEPQEASAGKIAGIISAVGAAIVGAVTSYIAYQKKKLCFKIQGGEDPESANKESGAQSDPQVMSNLLKSS
ncbi:CD99 molecule isoform X1 [Conger conger]|uniref:CD99 molecule isoform X1 n=1 Tax=Conger conger TaxID=82655 RepID=UPI002A5A99BC|nr:CD99 molecule isoform X1 [Conger conger]XP_061081898.1 CD99 molecule isoform X1 [Conger conger]